MKKALVFALALALGTASAQTVPPSYAMFTYSAGSWVAAISASTTAPLTYVPPAIALYCYNSTSGQWVPADSSCFTGGGAPGPYLPLAGGTLTGPLYYPHSIATGVPTIVCGTGAGTAPSVCTITGNDEAGQIAITTGTAPANAGLIATITLHNACPTTVYALIRASNANAASLSGTTHEYPDNFTATTWTVTANTTGLASTTAYTWAYMAKCN